MKAQKNSQKQGKNNPEKVSLRNIKLNSVDEMLKLLQLMQSEHLTTLEQTELTQLLAKCESISTH